MIRLRYRQQSFPQASFIEQVKLICYIKTMISNVLKEDHAALLKLCKAMKPEQRLVAFLNHSRLIHRLYQAGKASRSQSSTPKARKKTRPEQ